MNAKLILTGFQLINTAMKLIDPHGRDGNARLILSRYMSGELDEGAAVEQVMDHMRSKGRQTMEQWNEAKEGQGV